MEVMQRGIEILFKKGAYMAAYGMSFGAFWITLDGTKGEFLRLLHACGRIRRPSLPYVIYIPKGTPGGGLGIFWLQAKRFG